MGAILGIVFLMVALVVMLGFWGANRWSSTARDREKTRDQRSFRTSEDPRTDKRGAGIN